MRTDELNLQFTLAESATSAMQAWRGAPPAGLAEFEEVDDSYNSVTYERKYLDWPGKIMAVMSFGLLSDFNASLYRGTVRFDAEGDHRTKVTIVGTLDEETRAALGRYAAERGQIVQDWGLPTAP